MGVERCALPFAAPLRAPGTHQLRSAGEAIRPGDDRAAGARGAGGAARLFGRHLGPSGGRSIPAVPWGSLSPAAPATAPHTSEKGGPDVRPGIAGALQLGLEDLRLRSEE